jgi:hypothetical protein
MLTLNEKLVYDFYRCDLEDKVETIVDPTPEQLEIIAKTRELIKNMGDQDQIQAYINQL